MNDGLKDANVSVLLHSSALSCPLFATSLHKPPFSCLLNQMVRPNECPMISDEAFNLNCTLTGGGCGNVPFYLLVFLSLFSNRSSFSSVLQRHSTCHQTQTSFNRCQSFILPNTTAGSVGLGSVIAHNQCNVWTECQVSQISY